MSRKQCHVAIKYDGTQGEVVVNRKDMSPFTRAATLHIRAGDPPVLRLEIICLDVTEVRADARVECLVGGQPITSEDVADCRAAGLDDLAGRIAAFLPDLRSPFEEPTP